MTTVLGTINEADFPVLGERLSEAYRIAFSRLAQSQIYYTAPVTLTYNCFASHFFLIFFCLPQKFRMFFECRQQSLHLGLTNASSIHNATEQSSLSNATIDNKTTTILGNQQSTNGLTPIMPTSVLKYKNAFESDRDIPFKRSSAFIDGPSLISAMLSTVIPETLNISTTLSNATIPLSLSHGAMMLQPKQRQKRAVVSSNGTVTILPTPVAAAAAVQSTQIIFKPTTVNTTIESNDHHSMKPQSIGLLEKALDDHKSIGSVNNKKTKDDKKPPNSSIIGRIRVLIHNVSVIDNTNKDYNDDDDDTEKPLNSQYFEYTLSIFVEIFFKVSIEFFLNCSKFFVLYTHIQ